MNLATEAHREYIIHLNRAQNASRFCVRPVRPHLCCGWRDGGLQQPYLAFDECSRAEHNPRVDGRQRRVRADRPGVGPGVGRRRRARHSSRGSFLVARTGTDTFTALTAICTHQQCTVTGFADNRYVCPCHGSQYDVWRGGERSAPSRFISPDAVFRWCPDVFRLTGGPLRSALDRSGPAASNVAARLGFVRIALGVNAGIRPLDFEGQDGLEGQRPDGSLLEMIRPGRELTA
jgi:hypothetical protein